MNALLELRKQMEIDFLKTKTYEEINDMFNQMNDKLRVAESEVKKFRLGAVSGRSEQLKAFMEWHRQGFNTYNKMSIDEVIKEYEKSL